MSTSVYVLELQDGSLYVGRSDNVPRRVHQHASGQGALFTRERGMHRVLHVRHGVHPSEEQAVTCELMRQYGVGNVRGGSYSQRVLSEATEERLQRSVRRAERLCSRCGRDSHTASQCYARTTLAWECVGCSQEFETERQLENHAQSFCPASRRRDRALQAYERGDSRDSEGGGACFRCGRTSHWAAQCYARTHV